MNQPAYRAIREQILEALRHPEAEEGLYFRNFFHLHEEDERPAVIGEQSDILKVLNDLVSEGVVSMMPGSDAEEDMIFSLVAVLPRR